VSYPVIFEADYVEQRNRLSTFFRLILMIPLVIWLYFYGIVAYIALVIAWFAIVITGQYPQGLYDFIADYTRFLTRTTAYGALLCDPYPSFGGSPDPAYPIRMEFSKLTQYNRLKTLFRNVVGLLLQIGAFAAWFVILFTGKMPRGLYDLMVFANSYTARSDCYLFLLTETYPPFEADQTRTVETPGPASPEYPPAV
jgi:hypothetical protein